MREQDIQKMYREDVKTLNIIILI